MKNQYFGDKKDMFKFGISLKLLKCLSWKRFTWIAMLTPDDSKGFACLDKDLIEFFGKHKDI
ncbi:hypothetical protein JCM9492_06070 [Aquifex pyrophilus]